MSTHDSLILTDTLIQQNGYQGFSYADLADGLGIRKASIHYHFQTKTDLGLAYCEYKEASLLKLEAALLQLPPGKARLQVIWTHSQMRRQRPDVWHSRHAVRQRPV
ncbi:TetR/AcrR family transcriptional regulator [Enterobacter roggenkampii]|uniref:TetR/AcrR family transcriptional regulator n=1 Tax=Enterobacter roggenkampii TaxID=1812935 RepID=UPI001D073721|nr:TetR/AcrR family transcriptional regulator [Enterobacter roggenkampii]